MAQAHQAEIYDTLPSKHIRILQLLPGKRGNPIKIELTTRPISKTGDFEALSYTWGTSDSNLQTIECDCHAFRVTSNLFAALQQFRDLEKRRSLWVDAVCIDQSSIPERNQQVAMMLEIYRKATQVLIWLGEDTGKPHIKTAFNLARVRFMYVVVKLQLRLPPGDIPLVISSRNKDAIAIVLEVYKRYGSPLFSQCDLVIATKLRLIGNLNTLLVGSRTPQTAACQNVIMMPNLDTAHVRWASQQAFPDFDSFLEEAMYPKEWHLSDLETVSVMQGLSDIVAMTYWSRAWIVQEVIVSRKAVICCGAQQVEFDTFGAMYGDAGTNPNFGLKNFVQEDVCLFDAKKNMEFIRRISAAAREKKSSFPVGWNHKNRAMISQLYYYRKRIEVGSKEHATLSMLLQDYGEQMATDPKDHIFSLVGLLRLLSSDKKVVRWCKGAVDYASDDAAVFKEAAKHLVENFKPRDINTLDKDGRCHVHILEFWQLDGDRDFSISSTWIPKWGRRHSGGRVLFDTRHRQDLDKVIAYDAHVDGDTLIISGHRVDTINHVSDQITVDQHFISEIHLYEMIVEYGLGQVYGSLEQRFDAFWRTVIADNPIGIKSINDNTLGFNEQQAVDEWLSHCRDNHRKIKDIWGPRIKLRPWVAPKLAKLRTGKIPIASNPLGLPVDKFETLKLLYEQAPDPAWNSLEAKYELTRRHFIITKKGFFGLAPPGVEIGDDVAIIGGYFQPCYLRRRSNGVDYAMTGVGWCHGLMYPSDGYYKTPLPIEQLRIV